MRRLITGLVVLAATVLMPIAALAGNQEIANQIAKNLRDGGQLKHYKIGVKYQNGTAWLRGFVADQQQMTVALNLVAATEGVERVVNELQLGMPASQATVQTPARQTTTPAVKTASMPSQDDNQVRTADLPTAPVPPPRPQPQAQAQAQPQAQLKFRQPDQGAEAPRSVQTLGKPTGVPETLLRLRAVASLARTASKPASQAAPRRTKLNAPQRPIPVAFTQPMAEPMDQPMPPMPQAQMPGGPIPAYVAGMAGGVAPARYDQPYMPNYSWPSYAAYPNYAALTYPRQYAPSAWPYIGPFYPYPQVPLGWRKVTLEWDDGWWMLDFKDTPRSCRW